MILELSSTIVIGLGQHSSGNAGGLYKILQAVRETARFCNMMRWKMFTRAAELSPGRLLCWPYRYANLEPFCSAMSAPQHWPIRSNRANGRDCHYCKWVELRGRAARRRTEIWGMVEKFRMRPRLVKDAKLNPTTHLFAAYLMLENIIA